MGKPSRMDAGSGHCLYRMYLCLRGCSCIFEIPTCVCWGVIRPIRWSDTARTREHHVVHFNCHYWNLTDLPLFRRIQGFFGRYLRRYHLVEGDKEIASFAKIEFTRDGIIPRLTFQLGLETDSEIT